MKNKVWVLGLAMVVFLMAGLVQGVSLADASQEDSSPLTILVIGDSLGEGLYHGLYWSVRSNRKIRLVQMTQVGSGLAYLDMDSWRKRLRSVVNKHSPEIAVVLTGGNDQIPILVGGRQRQSFKSEEWKELYHQRVSEFMGSLEEVGLRVYWIGLPAMRQTKYDRDMEFLNEIYMSCAIENRVAFLPTRSLTVDENGAYAPYALVLSGKKDRIRSGDGKHFTASGYELLGHWVLNSILSSLPSYRVADSSQVFSLNR